MKILITGSNGQLGSEIKFISELYPEFTFLFHDVDTLDLTNKEQLNAFVQSNKPDVIVNCAAYTAVDKAETDFDTALLINCTAVENIAKAAELVGAKIIHVSTDYVFDGMANLPYKEEDKINPVSAYGKTKLEGEKALEGNKNALIIRTSWLYSAYGSNFVKTMLRLGKEKEQLSVIFDQVGTPTNAADLAVAVLDILKQSKTNFVTGIYHFSNEGVCSWYDFSKEIMTQAGLNCKVLPVESHEYPSPTKRPTYSVLNKKKIKTVFGLTIPWWKESLEKCINRLETK